MLPVIITILVIAAGFMVFAVISGRKQAKAKAKPDPTQYAALTVADASRGDVLLIAGAGPELDDLSLTVDRVNRYQGAAGDWVELSGIAGASRVHLEVYDDDELECWLQEAAEPTLAELGIDEDALARFDEAQDRSHAFDHDGQAYRFERSGEAFYRKDGAGSGEGFYLWEFTSSDGRHAIGIEKWEDEPFSASRAQAIEPSRITVLRS
jgi:hypothetical protein